MDTMLSKALRKFTTGPLNQLIVNLSGQNGHQWEGELKKFLRKEPCWVSHNDAQVLAVKPNTNLLELVSTVVVPASTERFIAEERFVCDTGRKTKVKIRYITYKFTHWFLLGEGLNECISTGERTLRCYKLRESSVDVPIITELGGEKKAETTLSDLFAFIERQGRGEPGMLLNNKRANIFYIRDHSGLLRSVRVRWCDGGWRIDAVSTRNWSALRAGNQVFSCNQY